MQKNAYAFFLEHNILKLICLLSCVTPHLEYFLCAVASISLAKGKSLTDVLKIQNCCSLD